MATLERNRNDASTRAARLFPAAGAGMVALAPAWLLAGLLYHPFIPDLTDKGSVAAAITPDTIRWGLAHLIVGIGAALVLLAFLALARYLRQAGEQRWEPVAVPLLVLGSTLFAFLPAMEIAMLGAVGAGADTRAVLVAMDPWFLPILLGGSAAFAPGILCFAGGLVHARVLAPRLAWTVAVLLVFSAATRFVPSHPALTVGGVALVAALWPLAYQMYRHPTPSNDLIRSTP